MRTKRERCDVYDPLVHDLWVEPLYGAAHFFPRSKEKALCGFPWPKMSCWSVSRKKPDNYWCLNCERIKETGMSVYDMKTSGYNEPYRNPEGSTWVRVLILVAIFTIIMAALIITDKLADKGERNRVQTGSDVISGK